MNDGERRDELTGWRRPPTVEERRALAASETSIGLCLDCRHLRLLDSGRTRFVRCWLAETDSGFPRYPALPVLGCDGHRPCREE